MAFLDATCKVTASIPGRPSHHCPNATATLASEKAERREHLQRANVSIAAKRAQLEQFVLSNKANANTASEARSKAKQLERLNLHQVDEDDAARGHIRFPPLPQRDGPAIICQDLVVGYGSKCQHSRRLSHRPRQTFGCAWR